MLPDGRVECRLRPRFCKLKEGQRGLCFVCQWVGDRMVLTTDSRSSGVLCRIRLKESADLFLYVISSPSSGSVTRDRILRFDGASGAFLGQFIPPSNQLPAALSDQMATFILGVRCHS